MTANIFLNWLKRFYSYSSITGQRKAVFLIIDNFSAHERLGTLPELEHVKISFLPPNTTSKMQPCDTGSTATTNAALFPTL